MLRIIPPTTRFHVLLVDAPIRELLFEQRPAHVGRTMQLSRAVVVQNLRKNSRVTIEEYLRRLDVVIGRLHDAFNDPIEPRVRELPDRAQVSLVFLSPNVQTYSLHRVRSELLRRNFWVAVLVAHHYPVEAITSRVHLSWSFDKTR